MAVSRRFAVNALVLATALAAIGAAVALGLVGRRGLGSQAQASPKAVVDQSPCELGVIESPEEFHHAFVIRNEGESPLQLAPGPSSCKCMVADVPETPVPPGGQAEILVHPSSAALNDELKSGPVSRGFVVRTNDPDQETLVLVLSAKVHRRLAAAPSPLTLHINSVDSATEEKRSSEVVVYSQRWDRFDLSTAKASLEGMKWRIEPASENKLHELEARGGYRVAITMPPGMADGPFSEWIEFAAKPTEAGESVPPLRLKIQGRLDGRLTFHGAKITAGELLQLGSLRQGEPVHESVMMKVNDERRKLVVTQIETKPEFLRAKLAPYANGLEEKGLYRIEVEIPSDAPAGAFTGKRVGLVRLKTDHPRLPTIELKVDFVVGASGISGGVAAR